MAWWEGTSRRAEGRTWTFSWDLERNLGVALDDFDKERERVAGKIGRTLVNVQCEGERDQRGRAEWEVPGGAAAPARRSWQGWGREEMGLREETYWVSSHMREIRNTERKMLIYASIFRDRGPFSDVVEYLRSSNASNPFQSYVFSYLKNSKQDHFLSRADFRLLLNQ